MLEILTTKSIKKNAFQSQLDKCKQQNGIRYLFLFRNKTGQTFTYVSDIIIGKKFLNNN